MFRLNDPFAHMNSIMNQFMMDPFTAPNQRQPQQAQQRNQVAMRNNDPFDPFGMSLSPFDRQFNHPFSLMNQMMGNFDNVFRNFDQMSRMPNDPNAQVFSSSSVVTYSNTDGKPKIFQQSKQIHQGPGGVRETREMVRDSERGLEKMAIGHHIGEKAHIIERQKLNGQIEETVNLENLDDEELPTFNQEFESRISSHMRSNNHSHNHRVHHHLNNNQPLAIEDNKSRR